MKTVIVIPTYNEAESIGQLLDGLHRHVPDAEIVIVDDGSPDGTADLVEQRNDSQVQVLRRTSKDGLGVAYRTAYAAPATADADIVVQMDADGSHRPVDVPVLIAAIADNDVVIGSRWVPGGEVINWPLSRKVISRVGNAYTQVMLRLGIKDATAGFKAFRRSALDVLDLDSVASQGYCFQVDMNRRAVAAGLRVQEVPITFVEREHGTSKMSGEIVREALWRVTLWGVARIVRRLLRRSGSGAVG